MDILNKVLLGWKLLFEKVVGVFKLSDLLYLIPLVIAMVLIINVIVNKIKYYHVKKIYRVIKNKKNTIQKMTNAIQNNRILKSLLFKIAVMLGMFNKYSFQKNLEYSTVVLLGAIVFSIISMLMFIPITSVIWYILLFYIFMSLVFVTLTFYVFTIIAKSRFNNQLPQTFKILNSRYITQGNIMKAIDVSLQDFDKSVRREMIKIYNVLKKNDMDEINNTFKMIESTYKNEYVTLLLNLIKQAHYKGGNDVIKKQIEHTTEEILIDIENQKDLSAASRTFIFIALILPISIKFVEKFNFSALGEKSLEFYSSPYGIGLKIIFFLVFMGYIGFMLFLERTTS